MHKNLKDLKITPDTCTEKCTKIAQGMKHYVISSSEKKNGFGFISASSYKNQKTYFTKIIS